MQQDPARDFVALLDDALASATFVKLVLSKPRARAADRLRTTVRPLSLKGQIQLTLIDTHRTRDLTRNLPPADALATVRLALDSDYDQAHLFTTTAEAQWLRSKKGRQTLLRSAASHAPAPVAHDRAKHRYLELDRAFLTALGVTDARHQLVPAMARKWKQINKFIEVLDRALKATGLLAATRIDVVDFGSGKGYLTFALHDYLRHTLGLPAHVSGVELRPDMVALCNAAVARLGLEGLRFDLGDVSTIAPPAVDVVIALHACDTATDHAIHTGVRAGARIIMCSPCCHKELRPQLLSPGPLRPILKHGVHLGQQAEMLTDGLRAMLLEACGYDTQVFEFVALEHTNKNKMILASKRTQPQSGPDPWGPIDAVKDFYGIQAQCLEMLLKADRAGSPR
ncbi:MAG: SAM-dependent methyltransferase [Pseudomonadota bacterium]|nr:SAM-dependent methyltransferase [Pseudomonadota bacterium]